MAYRLGISHETGGRAPVTLDRNKGLISATTTNDFSSLNTTSLLLLRAAGRWH